MSTFPITLFIAISDEANCAAKYYTAVVPLHDVSCDQALTGVLILLALSTETTCTHTVSQECRLLQCYVLWLL
jgi:hypothetical protein